MVELTEDLNRIIDHMTIAVVLLDSDLNLKIMNTAAERLLETSTGQACGQNIAEVFVFSDSIVASLRRIAESKEPYTEREVDLYLAPGRSVAIDFSMLPVGDGEEPGDWLLEIVDIDYNLRLQKEGNLLAQHRLNCSLIRGMAHEIKNPLGGLRGAAQLLERELNNEDLKDYTRIIIEEADRLTKLLDRMTGPVRMPEMESLGLHEVTEHVAALIEAELHDGIELIRDYDPSLPDIMGDRDQLIQALLNIVRNAAQSLGGKGQIRLRTRSQRQCTIGRHRYRLVARIDVVDDGPGIPDDLQEQIFYPMISGRTDGSGLGLPITQMIIHHHNGLVEFDSRPGKTVFTILLPLDKGTEHGR